MSSRNKARQILLNKRNALRKLSVQLCCVASTTHAPPACTYVLVLHLHIALPPPRTYPINCLKMSYHAHRCRATWVNY